MRLKNFWEEDKDFKLKIKPSICIECGNRYVKTKGKRQTVCLICLRRKDTARVVVQVPYTKKDIPKIIGRSEYGVGLVE